MPELLDIAPGLADDARQAGLMRLQLYVVGRTHALVGEVTQVGRTALLAAAGDDGPLDAVGYLRVQAAVLGAWRAMFPRWVALFYGARREAAKLAFGGWALYHAWAAHLAQDVLTESRALQEQDAPTFNPLFEPQLNAVLDAADARLYGDGLDLSARIWQLDEASQRGIRQVLAEGVSVSNSAWNLAQKLEQYLGAGAECPRWTSTRLYGLSKQQIADGDRTGLYSKAACAGQGVAYNALRLARNEIQWAHHAATDAVFAQIPWIEREQIMLSPNHPDIGCACEDVVVGGEDGDGVYPKGEITIPIHVQCLCNKLAELMEPDAFVGRLAGWVRGTTSWGAMDAYAATLGLPPAEVFTVSLAAGIANSLALWLWGDEDALDAAIDGEEP